MEKKIQVTGSMVITLNSLHYEQKRTLNDSWLKKEGEDNMKTENLQKRRKTRKRNAFIYFYDVPLWQACSVADHYRQFKGTYFFHHPADGCILFCKLLLSNCQVALWPCYWHWTFLEDIWCVYLENFTYTLKVVTACSSDSPARLPFDRAESMTYSSEILMSICSTA